MKTPRAIILKPSRDVELIRQDADGTLTFRITGDGCISYPFWLTTCDTIQDGGHAVGVLCDKQVTIGSKGGLTLS